MAWFDVDCERIVKSKRYTRIPWQRSGASTQQEEYKREGKECTKH